MLKGLLSILLCYLGGMLISSLIGGIISAGVIGMILLFLLLSIKGCKPEHVEPVARFLLDNLLLFFLPAAVGIMDCTELLKHNLWSILAAAALSTLWVLWITGYLTQKWEKQA